MSCFYQHFNFYQPFWYFFWKLRIQSSKETLKQNKLKSHKNVDLILQNIVFLPKNSVNQSELRSFWRFRTVNFKKSSVKFCKFRWSFKDIFIFLKKRVYSHLSLYGKNLKHLWTWPYYPNTQGPCLQYNQTKAKNLKK